MKYIGSHLQLAIISAVLLLSPQLSSSIGQEVPSSAVRAIGLETCYIDCSKHKEQLEKLLSQAAIDNQDIHQIRKDLERHANTIDASVLKKILLKTIEKLQEQKGSESLVTEAKKILELCNTTKTRAARASEQEEYVVPPVTDKLPNVTRAAADQWVVKKSASGNTVTFDPATGNIKINQDLQSGASVVFNGVTSTGAALTLDAAASNVINMGNTNATAVNIATAGTAATAVSIGTTSTVTDINIGASATTSTIDITGVATVVTGSTSARVDGVTLNLGDTLATDVNVGRAGATTVDVLGITTNITGSTTAGIDGTTVNLGNTTATTINMGTTASTDINIGRAATTTLDILGTTLNVTGTTTAVTGSTSARLDGLTVNVGNTTATDVNIGNGSTTVDITGTNITHTGPTSLLAGNELRFYNPAGTFYSSIKAGVITGASPATLVLPLVNGSSGNVLTTNGSGVLSWSAAIASTNMVDAYRKTSNQTTAATTEVVKFNQADVNPGSAYDPTTTWTYTVPTTGYYWVNAQVCVQPVDTGTKQLDLAIGGVAVTGYQSYIVVPTLTNSGSPAIYDTRMINLGCLKQFTAADAVTISYTGAVGDIILMNASHFSAYLVSA